MKFKIIVFSVLAIILVIPSSFSFAASSNQQQLNERKDQLAYIKSQILENKNLIEQINAQSSAVMQEIKQIDILVQAAQTEVLNLETRISAGENKIKNIQDKRDTTVNKLSEANQAFNDISKELIQSDESYWSWALRSNNPTLINLRLKNIEEVYKIYNGVIEENADQEVEMKAEEGSLLIEKNNLQNDKQVLVQKKNFIQEQLNNKVAILNTLSVAKDEAENHVDGLEDVSNDLESAIKQLQSYGYSNSTNIVRGKGIMSWPAGGGKQTSPYGYRIHPVTHVKKLHTGLDIGGLPVGTPVLAANDGIVIHSGWINGYGYTIILDHGNKISTLYGHNSKLSVKVGDEVKRGQKVAEVGSTGLSTGPHIHFEVRVDGKAEDPIPWL